MQSSARHLLLIIGSVLSIFGILLFSFMANQSLRVAGGLIGALGIILITRGIRNPQVNKNRKPDIRHRYKSEKIDQSKTSPDEIH